VTAEYSFVPSGTAMSTPLWKVLTFLSLYNEIVKQRNYKLNGFPNSLKSLSTLSSETKSRTGGRHPAMMAVYDISLSYFQMFGRPTKGRKREKIS
jgi:hypothetical protein